MTVLVVYDNAPPAKRKSIYALFIFVFPQKFKRTYAVISRSHTNNKLQSFAHKETRNIAINIFQFKQQQNKNFFFLFIRTGN